MSKLKRGDIIISHQKEVLSLIGDIDKEGDFPCLVLNNGNEEDSWFDSYDRFTKYYDGKTLYHYTECDLPKNPEDHFYDYIYEEDIETHKLYSKLKANKLNKAIYDDIYKEEGGYIWVNLK